MLACQRVGYGSLHFLGRALLASCPVLVCPSALCACRQLLVSCWPLGLLHRGGGVCSRSRWLWLKPGNRPGPCNSSSVCLCLSGSRSSWVSIGWGAGSWLQLPLCRFVRPAHNGGVARAAVLFFCLCVGGGCARRLLTCAQCVPLARPGFGTGWFCARVGECISAAWQRLGLCSLHLLGRAFARIMPCASLPLSLCVCRQLPDSCCFCGMLHLGRWGQPPVMQVRGLNPRIDVGHVTLPSSSSALEARGSSGSN